MDRFLLDEINRGRKKNTAEEQLFLERQFRFFLLRLVDHPELHEDLISAVAPLYYSELARIKKECIIRNPIKKIHDLLVDGDTPVAIPDSLTEKERAEVISSLIPDDFSKLKQSVMNMKLTREQFDSIAHTAAYFKSLQEENEELQKRIRTLQDVQRFNPEAESVFFPPPRNAGPPEPVLKFAEGIINTTIRRAELF